MPTGTIGRVRTVFTGVAGTPAYSNFYFDATTTNAADYQPMVGNFWSSIAGGVWGSVSGTVQGQVDVLNASTGQVIGFGTASDISIDFTDTNAELPPSTSGLLRLLTGQYVGGRQVQGRCFIPYPTRGEDVDGAPSSDYRTAVQAAAEELQAVDNANGAWVVWSRRNGVFEYINAFSVWNKWAVMRSRRD
jgi:hypothetical protein